MKELKEEGMSVRETGAFCTGGESIPPEDGSGGRVEMKWRRLWLRAVDVEEAKKQVALSLPLILTSIAFYMIPSVSVMFSGHLGELQLASSALAASWAGVTGLSLMIGLSGALETLCGQGFGANQYNILGIHLQSSCIISTFFSIIIATLWWYTEPILLLLHQSPTISKGAASYMKYSIPAVFAYGFLQNIQRFLRAQSVVVPLMAVALLALAFHVAVLHLLVHVASLGVVGASLAISVSFWLSVLVLVVYVKFGKEFKETWKGLSLEPLSHILTNLRLALPSAAAICLEYWAFQILVLLAGLMPNSETTTPLVAMWEVSSSFRILFFVFVWTPHHPMSHDVSRRSPRPYPPCSLESRATTFMITSGLSATVSTRVSNELGAGNPEKARGAMTVTLKLSALSTVVVILFFVVGHEMWAKFFSNSPTIIAEFGSMTPLLAVSILLDSIQGILSGVSRGCGWQHLMMFVNLAAYYLIAMPIACLLAFKLKLYAKGLWIGLICGLFCQTCALFAIAFSRKWRRIELPINELEERAATLPQR